MASVMRRVGTCVLVIVAIAGPVHGREAPFEFFAVSDLARIFEDGYNCPEPQEAIEIFGMTNEYLSAQCVLKAKEDIERLSLSVSPVTHVGGGSLPVDAVKWNFVGSIPIAENTPKYRKTDLTRPAPARFPDFLAEEKETSIVKGACKAIYLTLKIPRNAEPGKHQATLTAETEKGSTSLPLRLVVYPLTLPDERHLMVTKWYSTNGFGKFHGVDSSDTSQFYDMLRVYAENMAEHRQNVFRVSLDLIARKMDAAGKLKFDFSRFDKWTKVFWDTGRMSLLETGFVARFGEGGWSSSEIVLREFRVHDESTGQNITIPGVKFLPEFLPVLVDHLRDKGWLDKTVFHIADEPSNHNVMAWRKASEFVHRHAPELRRIDAIETTHCWDALEIWVPKLDHLATWYDTYGSAQDQGAELWFYTVGIFQKGSLPNKTVDVPLIDSRVLHWLNYRYGLKGYLHWGYNHWTDDPFNAPGKHRGDGWQVYPKKGGLIDSLRWEQMRNGIQDYEYLWMLEDRIRKAKDALGPNGSMIEPSRRGIEIASRVVRTMHECTRDPAALYAAKRQIVEELLDLKRPPLLLVQTNPLEHSTIANDCAVDVFGWAEPDAKVVVNGRELPVSAEGLFMENISLSRDRTIVVEAASTKGKKRTVRSFGVLY